MKNSHDRMNEIPKAWDPQPAQQGEVRYVPRTALLKKKPDDAGMPIHLTADWVAVTEVVEGHCHDFDKMQPDIQEAIATMSRLAKGMKQVEGKGEAFKDVYALKPHESTEVKTGPIGYQAEREYKMAYYAKYHRKLDELIKERALADKLGKALELADTLLDHANTAAPEVTKAIAEWQKARQT